jgi:hypothetical protein
MNIVSEESPLSGWFAPPTSHPPELPVCPVGGATHAPFESHTLGAAQSSTDEHVVRHEPPLSQL